MSTPILPDVDSPISTLLCVLWTDLAFACSTSLFVFSSAKREEELVGTDGRGWGWGASSKTSVSGIGSSESRAGRRALCR